MTDERTTPMMKCGHAANGLLHREDKTVPACLICMGIDPGSVIVDDTPPDLSDRLARCSYYGSTPSGRNHESNYGCKRGEPCMCEVPSSSNLPFFAHQSASSFDKFFCGCWGWS